MADLITCADSPTTSEFQCILRNQGAITGRVPEQPRFQDVWTFTNTQCASLSPSSVLEGSGTLGILQGRKLNRTCCEETSGVFPMFHLHQCSISESLSPTDMLLLGVRALTLKAEKAAGSGEEGGIPTGTLIATGVVSVLASTAIAVILLLFLRMKDK